ncbi:MAG: NHL domain-containing protein, partial [Methylobacter sp.]
MIKKLSFVILFALAALLNEARAVTGIISTIAGGGPNNISALQANINQPWSVALDSAGNQFIVAQGQHRVFKVTPSGQLIVLAGNGTPGFSGDGGAATAASLYNPTGVAVDGGGNVYIADHSNSRIRKVDASTGLISTVAGNGSAGFSGDGGAATAANLSNPFGVAVDGAGSVYIADTSNQRIRKVDASTGLISTVAGNGST